MYYVNWYIEFTEDYIFKTLLISLEKKHIRKAGNCVHHLSRICTLKLHLVYQYELYNFSSRSGHYNSSFISCSSSICFKISNVALGWLIQIKGCGDSHLLKQFRYVFAQSLARLQ